MCSTPKPKRSSQGKALTSSTSILAAMNSKQRLAFTKRANEACQLWAEKNQQNIAKLKETELHPSQKTFTHKKTNIDKHNKTWLYWFLSLSIFEIFKKSVLRH